MNQINRRKFLKTFSSAFAAAAISPTQATALHSDFYLNRALGIALRKPSVWTFGTLRKIQEMRKDQILSDEIDPALEIEVRNSQEPIVVFGEDCDIDDRFAASGALYVEHIELFEHENFDDLICNGENIYREILPDFILTNAVPNISICGFDSVRLESIFTYETEKISPISVRNISIITNRNPFIYTLRLFDSSMNGIDTINEFDSIIARIHYS